MKRYTINGPTMGARWSAVFHMPSDFDVSSARRAMIDAVTEVDKQMSNWRPESDLNRLNAARPGGWVALPDGLLTVLGTGLAIGHISGGAFDIGMGDATAAWGFGPAEASEDRIRTARLAKRSPAHDVLELDRAAGRARKHSEMCFDLNGIAKGYGADQLSKAARQHGIEAGLFAIDGEVRALGTQPNGRGWSVAVETPNPEVRAAHSMLELQDCAVATSGDYRHWIDVAGYRLSHTMDPQLGMPLRDPPASTTVLACDCMSADAWATAMMVLGEACGLALAEKLGLSVLFLKHDQPTGIGCGLFAR
ncbi:MULTISPECIES: FAD:protein FMN transferase [Rhizobium]|uniref:FAD:protein FMN transferase n=1 Tax=Rhizobium TaxID=379 RepID=UPI0006490B1D|nr:MULTISPECIES: FAD:protein FMN transferase [Rhizobium]MBB4215466.1 thiamine biosynthesis lipoprotein [Rhizobium sp. BK212]NKM55683.1 FAD:protein FMN transferase [Rhizobium anhuiense]PDS66469.1 FAD:protein FMN transferase [Rhizobium anhuiense]